MFFALVLAIHSLKPVFIVPGLMSSILNGNSTRRAHWYCPSFTNSNVWLNDELLVGPLINCLLDYITLTFDENTQTAVEKDGVHLEPVDFGGLSGVTYIDTLFDDTHIVPIFGPLIDELKKLGYIEKKSLFGIPYDWRFGLHQPAKLWERTRSLIESAYHKNGNSKVVLIGHSMGTYFIDHLCMKYSTKEWRDKYIDSAIFLAPSIGGSMMTFETMWTSYIPYGSFLGEYGELMQTIGGLNMHMPNFQMFGNKTLFVDRNGREFKANDMSKVLYDNNRFRTENAKKVFQTTEHFSHEVVPELDLPTFIIYQSRLDTIIKLDLSSGQEVWEYDGGDLVVNRDGIEYMCENWKNVKKCVDVRSITPFANHVSIVWQPEVLQMIVDDINGFEFNISKY